MVAEAVLMLVLGGAIGMAAATALLPVVNGGTGGRFPPLFVDTATWVWALGIALGVALAIGLPPALRARRLRIVDALAGHR